MLDVTAKLSGTQWAKWYSVDQVLLLCWLGHLIVAKCLFRPKGPSSFIGLCSSGPGWNIPGRINYSPYTSGSILTHSSIKWMMMFHTKKKNKISPYPVSFIYMDLSISK